MGFLNSFETAVAFAVKRNEFANNLKHFEETKNVKSIELLQNHISDLSSENKRLNSELECLSKRLVQLELDYRSKSKLKSNKLARSCTIV